MQALMFPDAPLDRNTMQMAFHRAWFALFVTPADDLNVGKGCKAYEIFQPVPVNDDSQCLMAGKYHFNATLDDLRCPTTGFWPYVFAVQYFVLLKLIMITLLYALFAATASKIEVDTIWKYQRYILVVDFANRLPLPAPLSIFCYIYYLLKYLFRCISCFYVVNWCKACFKKNDKTDGGFDTADSKHKMKLTEEDYNFWRHLAREYVKVSYLKSSFLSTRFHSCQFYSNRKWIGKLRKRILIKSNGKVYSR